MTQSIYMNLKKLSKKQKDFLPRFILVPPQRKRSKLYGKNFVPYDIVLMDIELPEKSGIILSKKILQADASTQIIFITQYREYCM